MPRGQYARNDARQQDEAEADADSTRIDISHQFNLSPEQRGCIFSETECQGQADDKRHGDHQRRFSNQLQRNLLLATAEEAACSHLLGAEARVGDRQVDVVAQGEKEDGQYGGQQDAEPRLVALLHARAIVLRGKHHFLERRHGEVAVVGPVIVIVQMLFHHLHLCIERSTRLKHEECLAGTCSTVGEDVVLELIAHHLGEPLHTGDDLRLVWQDGSVQVLDNGTDGIDQCAVEWVFVVDKHTAFTHNLHGLANGIPFAKEALRQSLGDDTLVGRIERRRTIALHQLEIEEVEERRIDQHDDAVFVFTIYYFPLAILDLSSLAHHAASLFHLGTHILDLTGCLRPDVEQLLIAHQVDSVGILVPRVDAVLTPCIVTKQDDKHERDGQSHHVYERI